MKSLSVRDDRLLKFLTVPAVILLCASASYARDLTFDERVAAQEAIERVYYSHQIGATKLFEEAVPRAVLENKVRTYLKQSVALERYWHTPITGEMLVAEMRRIAQGTRMPDRLREVYRALGNDPLLVAECVARPLLADRLIHGFFASDRRLHAGERESAEALRARLVSGDLNPVLEEPQRTVVDLVVGSEGEGELRPGGRQSPGTSAGYAASQVTVDREEFRSVRLRLPGRIREVGPLVERGDSFSFEVPLVLAPERVRVAIYSVRKQSWDDWWSGVSGEIYASTLRSAFEDSLPLSSGRQIVGVGSALEILPAPESGCATDSWGNGILD